MCSHQTRLTWLDCALAFQIFFPFFYRYNFFFSQNVCLFVIGGNNEGICFTKLFFTRVYFTLFTNVCYKYFLYDANTLLTLSFFHTKNPQSLTLWVLDFFFIFVVSLFLEWFLCCFLYTKRFKHLLV